MSDAINKLKQKAVKNTQELKTREESREKQIQSRIDRLKNLSGNQDKKDKPKTIRRKANESKGITQGERNNKEAESKIKDSKTRTEALKENNKEHAKKKTAEFQQNLNYDRAVRTDDPDQRPPVAQKKRSATFIQQFNRRKEAPDKKLIAKEKKGEIKVKKSAREEMIEILEKAKSTWKNAVGPKKRMANKEEKREISDVKGESRMPTEQENKQRDYDKQTVAWREKQKELKEEMGKPVEEKQPKAASEDGIKKSLYEKLEEFKKGLDNSGLGGNKGVILPSINNKLSKPGNNSLSGKVGIPGVTQQSVKDPMKQAQATQNKDIKDMKMREAQATLNKQDYHEMIKYNNNGQWSLDKMDLNISQHGDNMANAAPVNVVPERDSGMNKGEVKSLNQHKRDKKVKEENAYNKKIKDIGSDIQSQIDAAMKYGDGSESDSKSIGKIKPNLKLVKKSMENQMGSAREEMIEILEKAKINKPNISKEFPGTTKKQVPEKNKGALDNKTTRKFKSGEKQHADEYEYSEGGTTEPTGKRQQNKRVVEGTGSSQGLSQRLKTKQKQVKKSAREEILETLEKSRGELSKPKPEGHIRIPERSSDDKKTGTIRIPPKPESKPMPHGKKTISNEKVTFNNGGQWSVKKSDVQVAPEGSKNRESYKKEFEKGDFPGRDNDPAGEDIANMARRKKNNIDEAPAKNMPHVKKWGAQGANKLDREVKEMKAKNKKQPVKEFSPEEIAALNAERDTDKKKLNKSAREEMLEELEKSRCWKGYKPTPGKKAYEKDSCQSVKKEEDIEKKEDKPFHGYSKEKHSKEGGMSTKAREKHNRETGSNLQKPVTSKEAKGSEKKANRRKSFCSRMSGVKGPTSKDGKLTRKGAALKRWDC